MFSLASLHVRRLRGVALRSLCLSFALMLLPLAAHADEAPLSLLEAVKQAEAQAPNIDARQAALTSAERAVTPAGAGSISSCR